MLQELSQLNSYQSSQWLSRILTWQKILDEGIWWTHRLEAWLYFFLGAIEDGVVAFILDGFYITVFSLATCSRREKTKATSRPWNLSILEQSDTRPHTWQVPKSSAMPSWTGQKETWHQCCLGNSTLQSCDLTWTRRHRFMHLQDQSFVSLWENSSRIWLWFNPTITQKRVTAKTWSVEEICSEKPCDVLHFEPVSTTTWPLPSPLWNVKSKLVCGVIWGRAPVTR